MAAIRTHVFPIGDGIGYDARTPLLDEGAGISEHSIRDHLAIITRAVFQAGLSWAMLDAKWPVFVAAFDGFAVRKVAAYGAPDVDRIMAVPGMIRSRKKIEGTIRNARALLALEREFGSVRAYQTSAPYDALRRDVAKRFAYMGDLNAYYWLFRTGAPVPDVDAWMRTQERDHPRIREMVALERAAPP